MGRMMKYKSLIVNISVHAEKDLSKVCQEAVFKKVLINFCKTVESLSM